MMAQNRHLDIFAADLDVNDFIPTPGQAKPITQDISEARKEWARVPFSVVEKKKLKADRKQAKQQKILNNWKQVAVKQKKAAQATVGSNKNFLKTNRPNLTVIQKGPNTSSDNIKPQTVTNTASSQDMEKKGEVPVKKEEAAQAKGQGSGVSGRMTASSFMNVNLPSTNTNLAVVKRSITNTNLYLWQPIQVQPFNYPKGIPKSFLTAEHQQQLELRPLAPGAEPCAATPAGAGEPVWEALPPPPATPHWSGVKSRFDLLPDGHYATQLHQAYPAAHTTPDQGPTPAGHYAAQLHQDYPAAHTTPDQGPTPAGLYPSQLHRSHGQGHCPPEQGSAPAGSAESAAQHEVRAQYSPSDAYADMQLPDGQDEFPPGSPGEGARGVRGVCKRLSAFQRLGPVAPPKQHKLTINLTLQDEQAVREVVEVPVESKYCPVPERADVAASTDDTVRKYLPLWPWNKPLAARRTLTKRESKSVMQLELEQMEPEYEKDKYFFEISVGGYPRAWSREDVLDAALDAVAGKSLIPCFIQLGELRCRFLVLRSRPALVALHDACFTCRREGVVLTMEIRSVSLSVNQIDFIPRLVLRKLLAAAMQGDAHLNLHAFTLDTAVSHFIYFPLWRGTNQAELMQLQSSVPWHLLTSLDLSHNRIQSLVEFELCKHVPRLQALDVSHNQLGSMCELTAVRALPLHALRLEGNPLCHHYIHADRYIHALRLMFPALKEIDGVRLQRAGSLPPHASNYAPLAVEGGGGAAVASLLLDTLFPLLDATDQRHLLEDLYTDDAVFTLTYMHKLRYSAIYKEQFPLFARARALDEGCAASTCGADIARLLQRWPPLQHDPATFTVDVFYHTERTTMVRVSGVVKVATESLAEEEHVLHFTRTVVLHAGAWGGRGGHHYKVVHELLYWDLPADELARQAFRMTTGRSRNLTLKLDGPPDPHLKKQLIEIFMHITELDRHRSEKCLETKEWHIKDALEYFTRLLKLDTLDVL